MEKKEITIKSTLKVLEMLGAGKVITMKPCKVFNPDCVNCKLYLYEGMTEWFYERIKKFVPKKPKIKR